MADQTLTSLDVFEALHSTPARRYLSKKDIPDKIIWELLDAAIRAPSGGNSQGWNWIILNNGSFRFLRHFRSKELSER